MVTRRLWYALNHPPATHPLFWRTLRRLKTSQSQNAHFTWLDKLSVGYLSLFIALMFFSARAQPGLQLTLVAILIALLAVPVIMPALVLLRITALSGSYYGLSWAHHISRLIAREHENNTYELLRLFPAGVLSPLWALCAGCLYSSQRFNHIVELHHNILRLIAIGASIMLVPLLISTPDNHLAIIAQFILHTGLLVAALHIDFVQSLVLSIVLGIIVPLHRPNAGHAHLWTISAFLLIQVNTYTLACLIGLFIMPGLVSRLPTEPWLASSLNLGVALTAMFAAREIAVGLLWRRLLRLLDTSPADIDHALRYNN